MGGEVYIKTNGNEFNCGGGGIGGEHWMDGMGRDGMGR